MLICCLQCSNPSANPGLGDLRCLLIRLSCLDSQVAKDGHMHTLQQ